MTSRSKKWTLIVLLVFVAGYLLYRVSGFNTAKLWVAIRGVDPLLLCAALVLIYGCYALRALRWQVFQANLGNAHFWEIYKMTLAGFAAVNMLSRVGEAIRPLLIARKSKHPVADVFGIWALERLFDTASFATILAVGLLIFRPHVEMGDMTATITRAKVGGAILAGLVATTIGMLVYLRLHGTALLESRMNLWTSAKGWRLRAATIVLGFVRGLQTVQSWSELLKAITYSIVHWCLILAVYVLVCKSFGGRLGALRVSDCTMLLGLTLVGSIIQLPAIGGGFQAAAFVVLTKLLGIESEAAAAAAIVLWLVAFVACNVVGIPLLIREGVSLGHLRELAEHEKAELKEIAAHGTAHEKIPASGQGE